MQQYLNSTRRSLSTFKTANDEHRLDLSPRFQRNPVWTEAQKSFLIDSILRGFPIPELYIQETVNEAGIEKFVVVDGQQRLRACLEFLEGKLALTAKEAPDWPDYRFDDLSAAEKARVFGYNFIVRQLPPVNEEELRKIFSRLNRNVVALNQQELRHSTYWGEFITCMEKLAELDYWSTSGIFSANDIRRMLDIEFISELVIAYLHGFPNKKSHLDKWYATYEQEFPDRARVESCFTTVLGELTSALPSLSTTRWRKKSDFYSLFVFLARHESQLPLTKTSRAAFAKRITHFGEQVDKYVSGDIRGTKTIRKYGAAVERAASDLANRGRRHIALSQLLEGIFSQ
jgi:hypothetical protein